MLITRRIILSSVIPMSSLYSSRMPPLLFHLPPWLPANERLLLEQVMQEGTSLPELQRTNFARIREAIGDAEIVLIGEATHGTEEFYRIRADLTKCLLEQDGFDACLCESDFPETFQVNRFVGGAHAVRKLMPQTVTQMAPATVDEAMAGFRDRFPQWMWLNNAVRDFVLWLRDFNTSSGRSFPVQLLGLDIYSLHRSMDEVVKYLMDAGEVQLARQTLRRYSTLDNFRSEPADYGRASVPNQADNVAKVLTELYKRENLLRQIPGNGQELFNAIENAHVVAAAEAYFRQMYNGEVWNLRDSAFMDAVQDVIAYLQQQKTANGGDSIKDDPVRIVIWAHNSHVGDASATQAAARGKYNLGQLCRQVFGKDKVFIVGFSTFGGTVRAAERWGGDDSVITLNPAVEGSHEYLLHLLARNRRQNAIGYTLRSNARAEVDTAARELFQTERVERFVGVSYHPETELQSHYSICNLSNQFDYLIHVDETSALRVDQVRATSSIKNGRGKDKTKATKIRKMDLLKKHGADYVELLNKTIDEAK